MRIFLFVGLLILQAHLAFGQESKSAGANVVKVSREFTMWYYPDSFHGRRGLRLDIYETVVAQDGSVTAKATMHGRGLDRCTISNMPVAGRIENKVLFLRVVTKAEDNLTCRTAYELKLGEDGAPEGGKYKREDAEGLGGSLKRE